MDIIKLNYHEQRALLEYLKSHLLEDKKTIDSNIDEHYLLMAYHKLQLAIDNRNKIIACAD